MEALWEGMKGYKEEQESGGDMKRKKAAGSRDRAFGRAAKITAAGLLAVFLFTGCGGERMETRREIDRIYKAAEKKAEDRAEAYIAEKYGIDASAEGYWVQGHHDFFAPYVNSNVVVFLEYEGRKFCAGIDVDDETVLWDNYQREEIGAVLQAYFTELYHLPRPYREEIGFWLKNAPNYHTATPAEWREKGYDHGSMVDFYFQNQTAEELLARMKRLEFHDSWLSVEQALDSLSFEAGDWPVCEGGTVEWNLRVYASPEAEYVDQSADHPDIAGFPYFREWRQACLKDGGAEGRELSGEYWRFHSVQAEGISFITRLPCEAEDILCISRGEHSMEGELSAEEGISAEMWSIDRGSAGIQTYRLVSDVYEVTEDTPDSYYATVMHVPQEFADQYGGSLYILSRSRESGKVEVRAAVSSQKELDVLPEDEFNRDYKIHSNGTCGMSTGYQYAVAERAGEAE
ncbi:MAG: hypothetical protein HFH91_19505 [Lachnospiraceae bacterium]|nr:hypothetical protein [Lachnospiraceae bacterium]